MDKWKIKKQVGANVALETNISCLLEQYVLGNSTSHLSNIALANSTNTFSTTSTYLVCFIVDFASGNIGVLNFVTLAFIAFSTLVAFATRAGVGAMTVAFCRILFSCLGAFTIANHFYCDEGISKSRYTDVKAKIVKSVINQNIQLCFISKSTSQRK